MRTNVKDFLQDLMDLVENALAHANDPVRDEEHILTAYGALLAARRQVKAQSPQLNTQFELLGLHEAAKALFSLEGTTYDLKRAWLKEAVSSYRRAIQKAVIDQPYRRLDDEPWPDLGPEIYHSS